MIINRLLKTKRPVRYLLSSANNSPTLPNVSYVISFLELRDT